MTIVAARISSTRSGMIWGLLLFFLEAVQGLLLPSLFRLVLGPDAAAAWIVLASSTALIALACAAHGPAVVRGISARLGAGVQGGLLPANWYQLRRRLALAGMGLLLAAQLLFLALGADPLEHLGQHGGLALLLLFLGQHLRLLAFNNFMALNGLRETGRDKQLLLTASVSGLILIGLVAWCRPSVLLFGLGYLCVQAWLLWASNRALQGRLDSGGAVSLAGRREAAGLLLLALAGYLNMGSDVLVGSHLLQPEEQLRYVVVSRAFYVPVAVVGLWCQLRFPFWSALDAGWAACLAEIRQIAGLLLFPMILMLAAAIAWLERVSEPADELNAIWVCGVLFVCSYAASLTVCLGQVLLARGRKSFVWFAAPAGCLAPVLAAGAAQLWGAGAFVSGYLASNLMLLLVHAGFAMAAGKGMSRHA
ncbi:hypothetical protein J7U46_05655 [Pelomonas sp. V22]|uniref:hypothetical protein n=1 Tax=Pelomonas sp. V22 TaxID=2822139 RepID=UPI0024A8BD66|nr:hypothetical protein [Pelomonas sp. V22]MDI4632523.1 hypothetical protein [Pelomonas sp. V22]